MALPKAARLSQCPLAAGVRTVCGLQARFSPAIRYARDLIAEGYIGEVLATTLVGSGHPWSAETQREYVYAFDASNGATMLTVPVIHALDPLTFTIVDFESVTASTAIRRRVVRIVEDDRFNLSRRRITSNMPVAGSETALPEQLACAMTADLNYSLARLAR